MIHVLGVPFSDGPVQEQTCHMMHKLDNTILDNTTSTYVATTRLLRTGSTWWSM